MAKVDFAEALSHGATEPGLPVGPARPPCPAIIYAGMFIKFPISWASIVNRIEWTGDLDDDCTAMWCGLLLRAEWMDGTRWWWAVTDVVSGQEIDSSNNSGYFDVEFTSGSAARHAAEKAAREYQKGHRT